MSFMSKGKIIVILLALLIIELPVAVYAERQHSKLPAGQQQDAVISTPEPNPIQQENQLPGSSLWEPTHLAQYSTTTHRAVEIEGYSWQNSAVAGETVSFSVSTTAPTFHVDLYRLGWYGGLGARQMLIIPAMQGHFYAMPPTDPQTGLIEPHWPVAFTIKVDPHWVSGIYIAKLISSTALVSYTSFIVRSNRPSDFVFIHAATTDEAYNNWGGKSLYPFNSTDGQRAYEVTYDRPFIYNAGLGYILDWEYSMIRWLEKQGYDVSYLDTTDVDENASLLLHHRGILIVGHSEYWSRNMRTNLEAAINSGVNLADFGGDTMRWLIRYLPSSTPRPTGADRIIVCYKDGTLDPLSGKDDKNVTVEWRSSPINLSEQLLLGGEGNGLVNSSSGADWVVADASSWVFSGTGLKKGDHLPGLVGYEYDKVANNVSLPPGLQILSNSPLRNQDGNTPDVSNATLYTAQSGARVFNAATFQWSWGLDNYRNHNVVNPNAQKITANILANFLTIGHH
jgi:hypothetical protein